MRPVLDAVTKTVLCFSSPNKVETKAQFLATPF